MANRLTCLKKACLELLYDRSFQGHSQAMSALQGIPQKVASCCVRGTLRTSYVRGPLVHLRVINYVCVTLQIFFLVILFAAYNGLVVLPVLLSIAGPSHHSTFKAIASALRGRGGGRGSKKDGKKSCWSSRK